MKVTRNMIIRTLSAERTILQQRIKLHDKRADRLAQSAREYERETEDPTEEEEAILDRMIGLSNREENQRGTLVERVKLLTQAILALEEEQETARPRPLALR